MPDIYIKNVQPGLAKKYRDLIVTAKAAGLTGHLVVTHLLEGMLDNQKSLGYPIIKKIKKNIGGE
mgnify:CR=1 FL=1